MLSNTQWFSLKVAFVGSIGGLLFGYDLGVISMALPLVQTEFHLNDTQTEMVAGFLMVGCTIGALIGGGLADYFGRKSTVFITCFVFITGSVILFFSSNYISLLIGRIVVGFGVAISAIVDVAYLTEVSPTKYRGAIVSTNELMITIGLLGAYCIDYSLTATADGWRYMFLLPALLASCWLVLMCKMPESPKWLIIKNKKQEALYVFQQKSESNEEAQMEFDYAISVNALRLLNMEEESNIFHWKYCLLVSLFLMIAQNCSGHASVLTYSINFFELSGAVNSSNLAMIATILIGIIKVIFTLISMCLVDFMGRRRLLLTGICGMLLGHFMLLLFVPSEDHTNSSSTSQTDSSTAADSHFGSSLSSLCCIIGTCLLVAGYAIGFGPMVYLITSELFPDQIRGRAIGYSMIANWLSSFGVVSSFVSIDNSIGLRSTIAVYTASCVISLLFVIFILPETQERSPHESAREIEANLKFRNCASKCGFRQNRNYAPVTVESTTRMPFEMIETQRHIDDSFRDLTDEDDL